MSLLGAAEAAASTTTASSITHPVYLLPEGQMALSYPCKSGGRDWFKTWKEYLYCHPVRMEISAYP